MQATFDYRWGEGFPNGPKGASKETGETIVANNRTGSLGVDKIGGFGNTVDLFNPDLRPTDPQTNHTIGVQHIHPYSQAMGGFTGVSFSGADVAELINNHELNFEIVQSGGDQFLLLRTAETPMGVDRDAVDNWSIQRQQHYGQAGYSFPDAVHMTVIEMAQYYHLAYYRG